jgi:ABC-type dipeptide/oligopeptide/nickel transport system permease subunit
MSGSEKEVNLRADAWRGLTANRLAIVGLCYVGLLIFVAIAGPWISPYDFLSQDVTMRNSPPSLAHWMGTDQLGRDVLSRVIYGARTALIVAIVVTGISLVVGVILGAAAGYIGGRADAFIMWLTDITMSVPSLLLVIVINTSLKPPLQGWLDHMFLQTKNPIFRNTMWIDFVLVFGAMTLILWPPYARLVRGQVLSIRNRNYVAAARALGLPPGRIIARYIVPNAIGPIIVAVSAGLGAAMVLESAFSFLGVGVTLPTPSWGNMISDGLRVWRNAPHLLAAPAIVLGLATIAFSFLGDGLNAALNPRQWKRQ